MRKIWIGTTDELKEIPFKRYDVKGHDILVSRCKEGYFATSNTCTHEEFPLSQGLLEDCSITCAKHGAKFDIKTGEVQALPAVRPLPTYQIEVEGNDMYILLEDQKKQSDNELPPLFS